MKTTKKRSVLNEGFKQFQRLPQWPTEMAHEAKAGGLQRGSDGRATPLDDFQLLVNKGGKSQTDTI
jgi:hypothetical protein